MGRVGSRWCTAFGADWWSRGLMIGLIIIGITVIVLLSIHLSRRSRDTSDSQEALEIVKRRYANGELDAETFERMKRELR